MAKEEYDLLVIGAGAAGSSAVTTIATQAKKIALVERNLIGGTCLNYGCDPTKTLLHIAHLLYQSHHANRHGLRILDATYKENERAIMMGETEGLVQLLVDPDNRILGVHILGSDGDNLLAPFVLAMQANIPISTIASILLPYPTLSEMVQQVAKK